MIVNRLSHPLQLLVGALLAATLSACNPQPATPPAAAPTSVTPYYGTLEPFAEHAIYFVLTDRFVNGDPSNDQREQGGAFPTFDRPVPGGPPGESANVGYLGGDFKGILDNAEYIRAMGFGAVWVTPIVDNPDAAFSGGTAATWGGLFTDGGKTGYHGYWGVNFFRVDEHLPSANLDFRAFTSAMAGHELKVVLDIVTNHGSPSFSMPVAQPEFGKIYGRDGELLADHQNLEPSQLDPLGNPLHRWFQTEPDIAQLSNLNDQNPEVLEYFVAAYLHWIEQGAAAFRIDTIGHVPHAFWAQFSARIRAEHPDFFMFAERFSYDPQTIAEHTLPQNGGISVLDFPLKEALVALFEDPDSDYATLEPRLFLTDGPYHNPYELTTFYDNHDMLRMNARDEGFIDAHNWLFTARGIPVIYYGSEIGFMRGKGEHAGNRNYFGQHNIGAAPSHPIHIHLSRVARLRATTPALQRGLQINLELSGHRAAFLRVLQTKDRVQTALVMLNKGDNEAEFELPAWLPAGPWRDAFSGDPIPIDAGGALHSRVPGHDLRVWLHDQPIDNPELLQRLERAMVGR